MKHINGFIDTLPLWNGDQFNLTQFEFPEIDLEHFELQPIANNLRLGHQIEYIFKQLLDHSKRYEVVAHNIQILRNKQTIGELDFIVLDRFRESIPIHIELSYKFYIYDPKIALDSQRLIGPNRKDNFLTKLNKTKDKQLPLIYSKEGNDALSHLNIDLNNIQQKVYFLGQLFYPFKGLIPKLKSINQSCFVGYWIRLMDFNTHYFFSLQFYLTTKIEWIHTPHQNVKWVNYEDAVKLIYQKHLQKRAPLLWILKQNGEIEKCFIVWW